MIRNISQIFPAIGGALVLASLMAGVSLSSKAEAQTAGEGGTVTPGICRAAIVFDRSGSVGAANMNTLRRQAQRLFEPGGLESSKIEIAFWSFSDSPNYFGRVDYNAPSNDFVPSNVVNSDFNKNLAKLGSLGGTNYEQALAYNDGKANSYIQGIVDKSDLIVFLTDGKPEPENTRNPARQAALRHYAAGREMIGGLIGTRDRDMNYVLNGSNANNTNTFRVSTNYNDLSEKLKEKIGEKCLPRVTPDPCPYDASLPLGDPRCVEPVVPYSLVPSVVANNNIVSGADAATFGYSVNNPTDNPSQTVGWSIKQLVIGRGQSTAGLEYASGATYRDGMSCAQLVSLAGGASRATCRDAAQGS
ncbi:MAG: VWA domain-containing protein, partial [Proteobacteria bacterium]